MLRPIQRPLVVGVLALLLSLAGPYSSVLAETDPNDTPGLANTLAIGTVGDTAASLATGSDVDWFRVSLTQDNWYVFETYWS
jgi:hypothetical protein